MTDLADNISAINRCNQRGGRMLSIIDLIERGTVDLTAAAFLACHISTGASFVVGAVPGRAGKTTVMGALLNLIPADRPIVAVESDAAIKAIRKKNVPVCAVAHEISPGAYYAYIWGDTVRQFFGLAAEGHTVATNLHADNYNQSIDQICRTGGTPAADLSRVTFFIFLTSSGGYGERRIRIGEILMYDAAAGKHRPLSTGDSIHPDLKRWEALFTRLMKDGVKTIEEVRGEAVGIMSKEK